MDCSPLSPMLLTDVDMDILTDTPPTPPPWTQWNAGCHPPPPFRHSTFAPPPSVSIWHTPVPPSGTWQNAGFAPLHAASFHAHWDAATPPECPLNSNLVPYTHTPEIHRQQPPHRASSTYHPTSVATLVNAFERSLTLAMPSSGTDTQSDPERDCERTLAHVIEDIPQTNESDVPLATLDPPHAKDRPDDSPPVQRDPTDSLGEELDKSLAYFLNLLNAPLERESTTPIEQGKDQPPPPFERETTEPLEQDEDRLSVPILDLTDPPPVSLPTPRAPTPPRSRRPSKLTRHNTHLVLTTKGDHTALPAAQASVQAGKDAQPQPHQGAAWALLPPHRQVQMPGDDDDDEVGGSGSARGLMRRTALGLVSRTPPTLRSSRRPRKPEGVAEARRVRTKRTRFVEEAEEGDGTSPAARMRRTGSNDESRRPSGPGPLRSILRNKHAMPYDKTMVRHAGRRRASVP